MRYSPYLCKNLTNTLDRKFYILRISIKFLLFFSLFLYFGFGNSLVVHAPQRFPNDVKKIENIKTLREPIYHLHYDDTCKQMVFFSGKVVSKLGKSVDSAEVEINGKIVKTDSNGFFRIAIKKKNVKAGNRFVMNIRKEGFGLLSKIYTSDVQNKAWVMTKATTKIFDPTKNNLIRDTRGVDVCLGTLSSRVDWTRYPHRRIPRFIDSTGMISGEVSDQVKRAIEFAEKPNTCNPGISISIPANSLVDSNGNPPQGKVLASISTVDIYDPDSMPGDYTAIQNERVKKKYVSKGPEELPMVHFWGRVVSYPKCTRPVSEATVEVAGIRKKTDKRGHFRISVPVKDRKRRRFVLNITKEGYGLLSKVYSSSVIDHTWIMTKATIQEFDPTQDVVLRDLRGIAIQSFCTGTLSSQVDWSQYPHRRTPRREVKNPSEQQALSATSIFFKRELTDFPDSLLF